MLFLQELHHIMMTSGPTLVMGLLGAVYTSSSSSPSASAAGNVLLGTAVMMCVFLGKPNEIHKAWYADRHVAMLVLAAIFALSLGLNFERLDRINTENFDTMLDKYCNLPILQNAQIACDLFKQTIKEAAEKMTIQNDAYLHTKNKQSLVQKLSIATFVVLFVSMLTYVVRFDSDSFVKLDATAWRQHIQMHRYTNWQNTLSFMGIAVWLGWVLYAQRRVEQTPSAYLSAQPGLQDILPYVSRHLRWLNSYLLLGFVFLIFAMTHARTWGSRVLVYAFLFSGLAVMGSIAEIYKASSETSWITVMKQANQVVDGTPQDDAEDPDFAREWRQVRLTGVITLAVALVCVLGNGSITRDGCYTSLFVVELIVVVVLYVSLSYKDWTRVDWSHVSRAVRGAAAPA